MQRPWQSIALALAWILLSSDRDSAFGDGGMLRVSGRRAGWVVTVFTAPTPVRVGAADLSVLVQDAESGAPVRDVEIVVTACPLDRPARRFSAVATDLAATNKLFRAAVLIFDRPGKWHLAVAVSGSPPLECDVDVAEAVPPWLELSPWFAWPLLVIGGFLAYQMRWDDRALTRSRSHPE